MKTKILWLTDPWDKLEPENETTLRWIQEGLIQGLGQHFLADSKAVSATAKGSQVLAREVLACSPDRSAEGWKLSTPKKFSAKTFGAIVYRTDPPVDLSYLHPLQLLALDVGSRVINPPEVLMLRGEKLETLKLGTHAPRGIVTSQPGELSEFLRAHPQSILKPLNLAQSKGIVRISNAQGRHALEAFLRLTAGHTLPVMVQEYLSEIETEGETRLWFLRDKLIGQARKTLPKNASLIDLDHGSQVLAHPKLTGREKKAAAALQPLLKKLNVEHTAIDLIGGRVTDINFTSPGLITQMERVSGQNLSKLIVESLVKRATRQA